MRIRGYEPGDDAAAVELWNACLPEDRVNRENFYRRVVYDVNFDPGCYLLAFDDDPGGAPAGFAYGTARRVSDEDAGLEEGRGWIVAMGTRPERRGAGTGGALLDTLEQELCQRKKARRIDVGPYATNYICPGVDKNAYAGGVGFLSRRGYETTGECVSMQRCLRGFTIPARYEERRRALEAEGFRFTLFEPADALGLFAFLREEFSYWLPDARRVILAGRAEERLLVARDPTGTVAGFALRGMDGTEERFGPFGVRAGLQGRGIGGVLFHETLENMVRDRVFHAYCLWTGGRNLGIYGSWGMEIYRTYKMMRKVF